MKTAHLLSITGIVVILSYLPVSAQQNRDNSPLPTFLIEREIEGAGQLTQDQLRDISKKSCAIIDDLGKGIEWIQSYVVENKIYCLYKAENEELIREHAGKGDFPVNSISMLSAMIGPETAKDGL